MKKLLCYFLCVTLLLSMIPASFAAEKDSGLSVFTDVKQYTADTFQDVEPGSWYEAGVKTVYCKDVMDGTGGGQFAPQQTMSWSQAVTIAVRIHANYRGQTIPAVDGPWYVRYLNYAKENGLLPEICPDNSAVDSTPITREGLAVLFRSVLQEKDLPAINAQVIPDLKEVSPQYQTAVSEMFAAGIFTGTDGGRFAPDSSATRAQVAAIVARLLCPAQRVSHDSRQNSYMADQMGNFYNGGIAAQLDDTVYYVYTASKDLEDGRNIICARTDDGKVTELYSAGKNLLSYLSVGPDGMLYFIEINTDNKVSNILQRLDPKTGSVTPVYSCTSTSTLDTYLFYDNQLYVSVLDASSNHKIGRVSNGKLEVFLDRITFHEAIYFDESFYAFNGALYFILIHEARGKSTYTLHRLDIASKKLTEVSNGVTDIAYQGGTAWTMEWTQNDKGKILRRFSLAMPELSETVREYTGEFANQYPNFYANGAQLYYQVSLAQKLWALSSTGEATVIATADTPYYEASCVTSQGILILGIHFITALPPSAIDVILPDGSRTNLPVFLNQTDA